MTNKCVLVGLLVIILLIGSVSCTGKEPEGTVSGTESAEKPEETTSGTESTDMILCKDYVAICFFALSDVDIYLQTGSFDSAYYSKQPYSGGGEAYPPDWLLSSGYLPIGEMFGVKDEDFGQVEAWQQAFYDGRITRDYFRFTYYLDNVKVITEQMANPQETILEWLESTNYTNWIKPDGDDSGVVDFSVQYTESTYDYRLREYNGMTVLNLYRTTNGGQEPVAALLTCKGRMVSIQKSSYFEDVTPSVGSGRFLAFLSEEEAVFRQAVDELQRAINKPVHPMEEQIVPGQTYAEVCAILGRDGTDIGGGVILYQWELENGKKLLVWFRENSKKNSRYPDDLIVSERRVTD